MLVFALLVLICGFCVLNTILIGTKMIQISSGSSLFDADAPIGVKIRKWFLLFIAILNILRLSISVRFLMLIWKIPEFYSFKEFQTSPSEGMSDFVSYLFLLVLSFFVDYLGRVYYSLNGLDGSLFHYTWLSVNIIFTTFTVCAPAVSWYLDYNFSVILNSLSFCFSFLITAVLMYYGYSVINSLLHTSYSNSTKITARLIALLSIMFSFCCYLLVFRLNQLLLERQELVLSFPFRLFLF